MKGKYYITTAIAYTSSKPHIGNTYEAILADSLARFKRLDGYDVRFQTGTDEHGQKIEEKAGLAGKTPKEFVDGVADDIRRIWDLVGVSYDKFIRTTDDYHEKTVQRIFKKLYEQGDIYKGSYEGWYCTPCESFWTESQRVDGKCPDCGREVKKAHEEAYFFKMSKYADRLMKYYQDNPDFIVPVSRKNEMVNNFLKPGLQDLCVSRSSFKWGIPVDFDNKHVVYVWLDALTNYITGLGYDAENNDPLYDKYWPADVHVVGKDIVRFHTIYWPIFLMALDIPLPKQVYGHGWLLQEGGKMSKSKGNVIYADDLVDFFGKDAVRYYVLTAMPQDNDGIITWENVIETINSDLANVFGNLISRTIAMSNKYFGGIVEDKGVTDAVDQELKDVVTSAYKKVVVKMDNYKVADALEEILAIFRRANKYIDETMPWALAKDPEKADRLATVLYNLTESIAIGLTLMQPFMPDTCDKAIKMFGLQFRDFTQVEQFGLITQTKVTDKPEILFARLDGVKVMEKVNAMIEERKEKVVTPTAEQKPEQKQESKPAVHDNSDKPLIEIDDFAKVQLKVALVTACEKVEKSKKLLKLTVKLGEETRTVVSGIALAYTPEELIGKKLVMVTNLKPAKLCGIVSEGMIVCAENDQGKLAFLTPEKDIEDGSQVF